MQATYLILTAALGFQELPLEEVTVEKRVVLNESVETIGQLTKLLEQLGDPTKREPGEEADQHFDRVESIFKTRAYLLIKLGEAYRQALKEKYALEAHLEEYRVRVKASEYEQMLRRQGYEGDLKSMEKKLIELRWEATVVADLYSRKLEEQIIELKADEDASPETIAELEKERETYKPIAQRAANVFGRADLEKKYQGGDAKDLKKELETLAGKVRDTQFEAQYLRQNVLSEYADLQQLLNTSHLQAIENATKTLQDVKHLEDQAAQVAVISKYMQDTLKDIDVTSDFRKRLRLNAHLKDEPTLSEALNLIKGNEFPIEPKNMDSLLDFGKSAANATTPPMTESSETETSPTPDSDSSK